MKGTQSDPMWESIEVAAKRLKRSTGHLARTCLKRLQKEGSARYVKDDGRNGHWEIRSSATLKRRRSGGQLRPVKLEPEPIRIESQGGTTRVIIGAVAIAATGDFTITVQPNARSASGSRRESADSAIKGTSNGV